MCVWVISPLLFMESRKKHQEPEAEKSRPVMYWCFCNNILEVVFLVKVLKSGTWGAQPKRALTVQMVTALWWFCLWGANMETFGIRVSHTYRSQDGQSLVTLENTHTHTICACIWTHTVHRGYIQFLLVLYKIQSVVIAKNIQYTKIFLVLHVRNARTKRFLFFFGSTTILMVQRKL